MCASTLAIEGIITVGLSLVAFCEWTAPSNETIRAPHILTSAIL